MAKSDSMVERVARAINDAFMNCPVEKAKTPFAVEKVMARAAMVAMREPTNRMCEAGIIYGDGEEYGGVTGIEASMIWKNMINAALGE